MNRYLELADQAVIERNPRKLGFHERTSSDSAYEINELNEKSLGTGDRDQRSSDNRSDWDAELTELIARFQKWQPPAKPFQLRPGIIVADPARWKAAIVRDLGEGPDGSRARSGALQADLAAVAVAALDL